MQPQYSFQFSARASIDALLAMIQRATKSIDIELFYILPDSVGRPILDALLERASAGVTIRILVDAMGSLSLGRSIYIDAFKQAKAHIRFFNSLIPFTKQNKSMWYFRNHRRTIIVDQEELMVGSFCIGEPAIDWTEISLTIKYSTAIAEAKKVFDTTWRKSLHSTFRIGHTNKTSTDCFTYLTQSPLQRRRNMYKLLVEKIRQARTEIILIAPYIIPDRRILRALRAARNRKLHITIITPRETDWGLADYARGTYIETFLKIGIDIYFTPTMLHAKTCIFDRGQAIVGTLNLDNISLKYNYECGVHIDDLSCVSLLRTEIDSNILANAHKLHLSEWRKRGTWTKCLEKLIWPVRKFL